MNVNDIVQDDSVVFTNGFFIDIDNIIVCTNDGYSYMYTLPDR